MPFLEPAALAIIAGYLLVSLRRREGWAGALRSLALLSAAGWVAEEGAISLYGFYGYSPAWSVFLGHVPVMVVLIWPVIIHSARDLANQLSRRKSPFTLAAVSGGIVLSDALLIEPVAVRAGLWGWCEPGIFGVPLIGLLGWAFFAFVCVFLLERMRKARHHALLPVVAPLGTHLLLLAFWWGLLRWVNTALEPVSVVMGVWAFSLSLLLLLRRTGAGKRVTRQTLLARLPGALFFFTLLWLHAHGSPFLIYYALAFIPPYLLMLKQQVGRRPLESATHPPLVS